VVQDNLARWVVHQQQHTGKEWSDNQHNQERYHHKQGGDERPSEIVWKVVPFRAVEEDGYLGEHSQRTGGHQRTTDNQKPDTTFQALEGLDD
jgi:hypothetical protein